MQQVPWVHLLEAEMICREYGGIILRRCRAFFPLEADALDVAQEVMISIMEKASTFRHESSILTWIYALTTRHCLNYRRTEVRRRARETLFYEWHPRFQSDAQASTEQKHALVQFFDSLDELSQQIFVYRFLDGMTQDEIAEVTQKSRRTIGTRLEQIEFQRTQWLKEVLL